MKETYKYIAYYLSTYMILLLIYGLFQRFNICIKMEGYECNFSQQKIINFITVIAYVITPIVAIIGFQNWKIQYKYEKNRERMTKIMEGSLLINSKIKSLRQIDLYVRRVNLNEKLENYTNEYINPLYESYIKKIDVINSICDACLDNILITEYSENINMNKLKKKFEEYKNILEILSSSYKNYLNNFTTFSPREIDTILLNKISSKKEDAFYKKEYKDIEKYKDSLNYKIENLKKEIIDFLHLANQ